MFLLVALVFFLVPSEAFQRTSATCHVARHQQKVCYPLGKYNIVSSHHERYASNQLVQGLMTSDSNSPLKTGKRKKLKKGFTTVFSLPKV